jgi:dTDP-4-amino-4,6-dideoxy-D-galactose acyltransferase
MATETSAHCSLLNWDSSFFGFPIARVMSETLSQKSGRAIIEWSQANSVRCLYFLANPDSAQTADLAHKLDFKFVDVRVQLCAEVNTSSTPRLKEFVLRTVRASDIAALKVIAREAHQDSRFFFDTNFPRARAEDLFATWIAKDCAGRADKVLTVECGNGKPLGYITCNLSKDSRTGQIGLVGVAVGFRGKGAGKTLISGALEWFHSVGAQKVFVVTQTRNVAAQRLYQAAGFRIESVKVWYHHWL